MSEYHFIHSKGGKIGRGTDTSAKDIDNLLELFLTSGSGKLVIHFHGGLVKKATGLATAKRLHDFYVTDAFPIFYVWESGVWETIRNNLRELADEPVFKQLVRKLLQYTLERLSGQSGGRSILPGSIDVQEVTEVVNNFWISPSKDTIPYRDFQPKEDDAGTRSANLFINEGDIQADLESDDDFRRALGTLPDLKSSTRSAMGVSAQEEHRTTFSETLAIQLSDDPGIRGIISWFKVASLVTRILKAVLKRYLEGRDHGLYATVVEEIARGVKLGGSGLNEWGQALQWNRMKKDVSDAFGSDVDRYAGTALIERLRRAIEAGERIDRITLIGHSTGAIYIAEWLEAAADAINVKFDVVFLAPAITYERFAKCLAKSSDRIRSFRSFAMIDDLERDDQIWGDDTELGESADLRRFVYPSSLLYLVSGILESDIGEDGSSIDSPDKPLLGMERFYAITKVYKASDFPEVQEVRNWLKQQPNSLVWSITKDQSDGLNSACIDHGAFDDDQETLASVRVILKG